MAMVPLMQAMERQKTSDYVSSLNGTDMVDKRQTGTRPACCSPLQRLCKFLQSDDASLELAIMLRCRDWYFRTKLNGRKKTNTCEVRQASRMAPIA